MSLKTNTNVINTENEKVVGVFLALLALLYLVFQVAVIGGVGRSGGKTLRLGEGQRTKRHLSVPLLLSALPPVQTCLWAHTLLIPLQRERVVDGELRRHSYRPSGDH